LNKEKSLHEKRKVLQEVGGINPQKEKKKPINQIHAGGIERNTYSRASISHSGVAWEKRSKGIKGGPRRVKEK